ncbi:hypothetical protein NC653_030658 [Populus alba x Populus x berolinensis]|uniref:Secreted protein n=1 Tax=Populus alba x Populus x berolinensis TaxID=444605 RepID=A0AAD6LWU2_9ROSI|nr:hypothetical protein NC653_030658 [Populus alba x Populus x berolinensis]
MTKGLPVCWRCRVALHFCWLQRRMALLLLSTSGRAAVKMEGLPWLLWFRQEKGLAAESPARTAGSGGLCG